MQYLPGFVNDFLGHLYLRRVTSISAIFYVLISSVFIANITLRQGFVAEKVDVSMAMFSKKFSSIIR